MRPRYFSYMFDDEMNGLYSHRSSELINRVGPPLTPFPQTKSKALVRGRRSGSTKLANAFVKKLAQQQNEKGR